MSQKKNRPPEIAAQQQETLEFVLQNIRCFSDAAYNTPHSGEIIWHAFYHKRIYAIHKCHVCGSMFWHETSLGSKWLYSETYNPRDEHQAAAMLYCELYEPPAYRSNLYIQNNRLYE